MSVNQHHMLNLASVNPVRWYSNGLTLSYSFFL